MARFLVGVLLAGLLGAQTQTQTQTPEVKDPLGRTSPQDSVFEFLEACHGGDYTKAMRYLDLRRLPAADRAKEGQALAQQLEDLLDSPSFDITALSRDPDGDPSDGLSRNLDHLATFHVAGQTIDLKLDHVQLRSGLRAWVVSADSVALIPNAHQVVTESPFEKRLPQALVTHELLETPVWRWIALLALAAIIWIAASVCSGIIVRAIHGLVDAPQLRGSLRLALSSGALRAAIELVPPATLPRTFIERALTMVFFLALAAIGAVVVDLISGRWHRSLDPRTQAVGYSILPLGRQILKLCLYLVAILGVLTAWGYNTTTILAGLGVGGLAVALAAQKTIENLFGGISVIGDRPVLVGDVCRFGDRVGEVIRIGLRSTRIRTPDRTIISIPNAQFSSMELENISGRDKIWFHQTLSLRRDTTSEQLLEVLASINKVLAGNPKVQTGKIPVRFIGVGSYSLDVETDAYVATADYDEFIATRQELLIQMIQAVERAGTGLAVPIQESFDGKGVEPAPQGNVILKQDTPAESHA